MTKRPHMSAPSSELPKRKASRAPWLALALPLACARGVGFALAGGVGNTPPTQLSLRLSQPEPLPIADAREVSLSLRLGGWPAKPIGEPEGTKLKAAAAPEAMPMLPAIAILIDDCGVDEARTRAAMALPAAMTLAVLPYGGASSSLSRPAPMAGARTHPPSLGMSDN